MPRRKSLRGKGADIFLLESEEANPPTKPDKRSMVTVYLPENLITELDRVYLQRRMKDRKAQKSHIVAEALQAYFERLDV
jgi:hypothetical protein